MNISKTVFLLIIIFCSGCNKGTSDLEFEKKVLDEIFVSLVDSLFNDRRIGEYGKLPPPPDGIIISEEQQIENQKRWEKGKKEFEIQKARILNDTSRVLIIVYDTIKNRFKRLEEINDRYSNDTIYLEDSSSLNSEYLIDLTKFQENNKFLFTYRSNYPSGSKIWRYLRENPPKNYYGAVVSFSRISFDKERKKGVLSGGISYGRLNGFGCWIFLRKEDLKWVVDRIIVTSIS